MLQEEPVEYFLNCRRADSLMELNLRDLSSMFGGTATGWWESTCCVTNGKKDRQWNG